MSITGKNTFNSKHQRYIYVQKSRQLYKFVSNHLFYYTTLSTENEQKYTIYLPVHVNLLCFLLQIFIIVHIDFNFTVHNYV